MRRTWCRSSAVQATHENIAYGAKSIEFMAPPNFAFRLMREATLRLAVPDAKVRSLINPRQSAPIAYACSSLNVAEQGEWASALARPGMPAPEALLRGPHGGFHLTLCFGKHFVCLVCAKAEGLVPVRPDGYVVGRWRGLDPAALLAAMNEKGMAS